MCDWPTRYGTTCSRGGYRVGYTGIELCSQHEAGLIRALIREVARDPFGEPGAYGQQILAALEMHAENHPDPQLWAWVARMAVKLERHQPERPLPPSWVYFAEREEVVKIGTTGNVPERLKALEAGGQMLAGMTAGPLRLLGTIPGGYPEERALHRQFSHLRVDPKREWFLLDAELAEFIASLKSVDADT